MTSVPAAGTTSSAADTLSVDIAEALARSKWESGSAKRMRKAAKIGGFGLR
jgi:hypothetical protein